LSLDLGTQRNQASPGRFEVHGLHIVTSCLPSL
jgi:hypothetical protein